VSLLAVLAMVPPSGGTKVSVSPLWKLLPLMVNVWLPFNGGTGFGETLLMLGVSSLQSFTASRFFDPKYPNAVLLPLVAETIMSLQRNLAVS
jgi:hypothetical protein